MSALRKLARVTILEKENRLHPNHPLMYKATPSLLPRGGLKLSDYSVEPWPLLARSHFPLCLSRPKLGILCSFLISAYFRWQGRPTCPRPWPLLARCSKSVLGLGATDFLPQLSCCHVAPICCFLPLCLQFRRGRPRARSPDAWATSRPAPRPSPLELIPFSLPQKRRAKKTAMDPGRFLMRLLQRRSDHHEFC
jgi:hypothetical protein